MLSGRWHNESAPFDNRMWMISHDPVVTAPRAVAYDRDSKSIKELFIVRPALAGRRLPRACPIEIKSRDGLTLVLYLTIPVGE
jgi:dipeptidyl aminopeptidase/acylaminoacyl peptidase